MRFGEYTPQEFRIGYRKGEERTRAMGITEIADIVRRLARQFDVLSMHDRGYLRALQDALEAQS